MIEEGACGALFLLTAGTRGFHAKAQREGKEEGHLNYALFLRVSCFVPTSPELQTLKERIEGLAAFKI